MVIRRSRSMPIREIIADFLKESKLEQGIQEQKMLRRWHEITGPVVSRNTRSVEIRNRKLIVRLGSSVIRNELNMMRENLLHELNDHFPRPLIDEIILK